MTSEVSRRLVAGTVLGAPFLGAAGVRGQATFPDRAIRLLVGFAAGGGTDLMARQMARRLEQRLGRYVTVENRPGGTGAAAGEALKKGAPDGTLMGFIPSTTLASKLAVTTFPFDPQTDLAPVSLAGTFQMAIAVASSIGVATFAEYAEWLKSGEADRARLGTAATDAFLQIFGMMLGREVGVPIQNVPYRGAAPLISDLLAGKIPAACSGVPSLLQHHRSGRARILLTSGRKPVSVAPNLPTAASLRRPGMVMEEFYGFFLPAATPPAIVGEWNRQIGAMLANREVAAELSALSLDVESSTPEELGERVAINLEQWKARMDSFGMKPTN
jgi:tripartite-type tricarboxylate transporter receptor subunit TctC